MGGGYSTGEQRLGDELDWFGGVEPVTVRICRAGYAAKQTIIVMRWLRTNLYA